MFRTIRTSSISNLFKLSPQQVEEEVQEQRDDTTTPTDSSNSNSSSSVSNNNSLNNDNEKENATKNTTDEECELWCRRLQILLELATAISFLHARRVIHRDLKPTNIGFDKEGILKVFDFDVARIIPSISTSTPTTTHHTHNPKNNHPPNQQQQQQVKMKTMATSSNSSRIPLFRFTRKVGSPRYMSPEVALGEYYNELTDVYALGLLSVSTDSIIIIIININHNIIRRNIHAFVCATSFCFVSFT